ncbi:MAG: IS3 family transposase [Legionella sp.]|nr:IS3 family transposase [Legionella sp.]
MGGKRGRLITCQEKIYALGLLKEACNAGSRLQPACELLGFTIRTHQRWIKEQCLSDKRRGPKSRPHNKLSDAERAHILLVANSSEYRNQPPSQIVPNLADKGEYIGSESTIYRVLHANKMVQHRSAMRPRTHKKPDELRATKPNQLWSWDITYLTSNIRGKYYYLYLFLDIFSRKIVGFNVFEEQSAAHASEVVSEAYIAEQVCAGEVTLHADNGGPMKGSMMLATLQNLGVVTSFSRPSVSNDNPYSESLFRTLKYCPKYPNKPFTSPQTAMAWVTQFVNWYNHAHLHSGINFVTPSARHNEKDKEILEKRVAVYELARKKNPCRWSGKIRNWDCIGEVYLNAKRSKCKAA